MGDGANGSDVAVAVPVLNEVASISDCLRSLLDQDGFDGAIIVMDGGSTDGTLEILDDWRRRHPRITVHPNPGRLQSAAVNGAVEIAPSHVSVIVRADAHAVYPSNFVRDCVAALRKYGATSVVVPMQTVGRRGFQVCVAAAQSSALGNGGAAHRRAGTSRFVDHGHHAAFDRAFFRSVGGYDESFSHNEDAELDIRALAAGGRIWMCAEAPVTYVPRSTMGSLARQYCNHGRGRARTLLRHGKWPGPRQVLPVAALVSVAGGSALIPFSVVFGAAPLGYAGLCIGYGMVAAIRARDIRWAALGLAAMVMHLSWALGFMAQVVRSCGTKVLFCFRACRQGRGCPPWSTPTSHRNGRPTAPPCMPP